MSEVRYMGDGEGNWRKYTTPAQCPHELWPGTARCQREEGHTGDHWCYRPDGWYQYDRQKSDIKSKWDKASGSTPPGHANYPHPVDKLPECYHMQNTFEDVTDPQLIEMLDRDETPEGAASICVNRPMTSEELEAMRATGDLPTEEELAEIRGESR